MDGPADFIIPALNIRYVTRANPAGNAANGQISHKSCGIHPLNIAGIVFENGTHQIAQTIGVSREIAMATIANRHAVTAGNEPLTFIGPTASSPSFLLYWIV